MCVLEGATVNCSRCGKSIPFAGKVCPFCGTDKSKDQLTLVCGVAFALIGGFPTYAVTHHIGWTALVGFISMMVGIILVQSNAIKPHQKKEDVSSLPEVKVRDSEGESAAPRVIQVRCGKCKKLNEEAAKFCNNCGAAM
jgi:RNA polymerase subunit RPABC4/transcription elongation factor Spt4